ncbi:MAG TPA: polyprenyl diphosphate synthase [Candidatus Paceibacterota bacterium]|nr:polyprenyl diphosphate synthase [Candidatus Paceibacterota bacterium]
MTDEASLPLCVGIIPDGNRRWALRHDTAALEGHRAGADTLARIVLHARDRGIAHIVAYAFSSENWQRSETEVSFLMSLIVEGARGELSRLRKEGVRIRFIGERERLAIAVRDAIESVEKESAGNTACTLWIAFSYGGRAEIAAAARLLAEAGEPITEDSLPARFWSAGMPDPDLIVRTSGEQRLSNFLLWQAAYSELFFTDTLWPDFTPDEFDRILDTYAVRERRHGK